MLNRLWRPDSSDGVTYSPAFQKIVEARYAQLHREWLETEADVFLPSEDDCRYLGTTIEPLDQLISRIKEALGVRAIRSEDDHRRFRIFKELPFSMHYRELIARQPFRVLEGIDNLLLFLDSIEMPKRSTKSKNKIQSGALSVSVLSGRTERVPHPDPEAILKTHPLGLQYRSACEVLGVGIRQVQALVAAGKLKTVGNGHARRVTTESLRERLGLPHK